MYSLALVAFVVLAMTSAVRHSGTTISLGTPHTAETRQSEEVASPPGGRDEPIASGGSSLRSAVGAEDPADEYAGSTSQDEAGEYGGVLTAGEQQGDFTGLGSFNFLQSKPVSESVTLLTLALLALVVYRYAGLYRYSRSALVAGFLASAILLLQGQIAMVTAPLWHLSWWEYHGLLFAAFGAALAGMVIEYARDGSLHGVVEGLLLRDAIAQLQRGYTEVIVALVRAVEAKDVYTRGHTERVADLSVRIGQELRLSPEHLRVVSQSAMLHDIGKIGVPDSILNKPGPLSAEEFEVIKQHPVRGHAIIKGVRSLQNEVAGVRHHHERLDGTGYPDGLRGDQIPMVARIIAVADVYDALTSMRPYRAAWSREQALELLDQEAGHQFDPACVGALRRALSAAPSPACVASADGADGLVLVPS